MTTILIYSLVPIALYGTTVSILWARASYASSQCTIAMDEGDMRAYHKWSQEASRRRNMAMRHDVIYRAIDRYTYRKANR